MSWWAIADSAAAAEFGRRHYRKFAAVRVVRAVGPWLAGAVVLVGAAFAVVHWGVPALASASEAGVRWSVNLVPAAIIAGVLLAAVLAGVLAWRRWGWLLEIRGVSGRLVSAAGIVLIALAGLSTVALW